MKTHAVARILFLAAVVPLLTHCASSGDWAGSTATS